MPVGPQPKDIVMSFAIPGIYLSILTATAVYMVLTCALVISKGFDEGNFVTIRCTVPF